MENRLNRTTIEKYSIAYSKKLVATFFDLEDTISGQQILELSNIPQLNLLIIKNLLQKWKKETDKLQSPYFDYTAEEVKGALNGFMNALSRNIAIMKNNFEPLLKNAVRDTMILIFSPYDFYSREINHSDRTRLSLQELSEISKYIKVNRQLLEGVISRFEHDDMDVVFNDEAFSILNEIVEETGIVVEDYSGYLQKFSETIPLSLDMVYQGAIPKKKEEERPRQSKKEEDILPASEEKASFPVPDEQEKGPALPPEAGNRPPEAPKSMNDNFFEEKTTLNDKLGTQYHSSLADAYQKKKIDSIKQHITLNQKFMFINELFAGDKNEFGDALDKLERCASYSEAMQLLKHDYVNRYNWNMTKDEVKDFIGVVSKKYG